MKTDYEIKTEVYKHIYGSSLHQEVNGVLTKTKRPKDSDKEDIVISVVANQNGQTQYVSLNVNIYVKDDLRNNQYEENTERTGQLSTLAAELLEIFIGPGYRVTLTSQHTYDTNAGEHVINNRLYYQQNNEADF